MAKETRSTEGEWKLDRENLIFRAINIQSVRGGGNAYKILNGKINHLTPELNPSEKRFLTSNFTGDFAF
jgi:hypothetical protein